MELLQKHRRAFVRLAPAILGMIFVILCLFGAQHSVTPAEARTVFMTRFDFGQVWEIAGEQGEGPLYYWLAKIWAHFFGHADYVLRVFSALTGAVTIMFAFLWLKYKYGLRVAVISASLMCISPLFVHFGQSAEAMTLVLLLTFAANYFLQLAIDHGNRAWWVLYAILMIMGWWTSPLFILILIAHVVYMWRVGGKDLLTRKEFGPTVFMIVACGALSIIHFRRMLVMSTEADLYNSLSNAALYMSGAVPTLIALVVGAAIAYGAYKYRLKLLSYIAVATWLGALLLPWQDLNKMPFLAVVPALLVGVIAVKMNTNYAVKGLVTFGMVTLCIVGLVSLFNNYDRDINTGEYFAARRIISHALDLGAGEKLAIITDNEEMYFELATYTSAEHPVLFVGVVTEKAIELDYAGRVSDFVAWRERHQNFWQVLADDAKVPSYEGWRINETSSFAPGDGQISYRLVRFTKEEVAQ